MIILSPVPKLQFISNNGVPLAGCKVYTYQAGTSTPIATYSDETGLNYNQNPILLDAGGRASVWIDSNISYKYVIMNSNGTVLFTQDNINSSGSEELIIVNTIADLQNINTTSLTNATVRVLGYYTPNDGGEGDFIFNSTSTSTPDNGAIVEPETGPGRWFRVCADEINILWYGCKGDGATDNSQYLQAANSYAQAWAWNLYVPEGNYAIDSNPAFTVPVRFACNAIFSWSGFSMPIDVIINDYTQHFACTSSATVAFKNVSEIYPEWFGALGDGSLTSNTQARTILPLFSQR